MKKILFLLALVSTIGLLSGNFAFAATKIDPTPTLTEQLDYDLPFPGILPDHPLYPVKLFRDRILDNFTRDPVKKVQLKLLFSDKKLVMGQLLWEKQRFDLSESTLMEGEKDLLIGTTSLSKLKYANNLPAGLGDKLELAAKKHEEIISKLLSGTLDEARQANLGKVLEITHQAIQQISIIK